MRGWSIDQSLDLKTAREALKSEKAERVGDSKLDPYVQKAFDLLNNKNNEHANWIVYCNCKTETNKLVSVSKSLQTLEKAVAAAKGYDSVKVNSNATVTATYTRTGSRIQRTLTCDDKGTCE